MKTVKQQQQVCTELLKELYLYCPSVRVAGGAPRDWYFGKVGRDLDIYLNIGNVYEHCQQVELLEKLCPDLKLKARPENYDNEIYKKMQGLVRVIHADYKGEDVNLIMLSNEYQVSNINKYIDLSICQISCGLNDMSGGMFTEAHINFKKSVVTKTLFFSTEGYSWQDQHASKVLGYFPDWKQGTLASADNTIINNVLSKEFDK